MKHGAFQKYFDETEEMVRRDINMFGIEEAQTRLRRRMRSVDGALTGPQIGKLFDLVFKL